MILFLFRPLNHHKFKIRIKKLILKLIFFCVQDIYLIQDIGKPRLSQKPFNCKKEITFVFSKYKSKNFFFFLNKIQK